jgi:hypothetical protein
MANDPTGMASLQKALEQVNRMPRLAKAVQDVDRIIDLLTQAKAEVLRGSSQFMPLQHHGLPLMLSSLGSPHVWSDHDQASEPNQASL